MRRPRFFTPAILLSSLLFVVACDDNGDPTMPDVDPPVVTTGIANTIGESSALLAGTVDALGMEVVYWFDYGLDQSYGSSTPETTLPACECGEEQVGAPLSELRPETWYHYRLVARNAVETVLGEDARFITTLPNRLPETHLVAAPPDTTAGVVSWHLYWTGMDLDGEIVRFELRAADHGPDGSLDPADSLGVPWTSTVVTDSVLTWPDGLGARTVFVRAIDHLEAIDPSPAELSIFP